jgi:NodT family efflux transporter outer membrane factor (OMF) lipoprotein
MRFWILALLLLAMAACTVGPQYRQPPVIAAAPTWTEAASTAAPEKAWWRTFGDPVLDCLVADAVAHNLDVRQAKAQLDEARANRDATAGGRLPQVSASGSATTNQISANGQIPIQSIPGFARRYSLFDGGFDASWEVDLWGRTAQQLLAADARAISAQEAQRSILIQTIAEVVRTYVDLRSAQARLASVIADAEARGRTAALVRQRFNAGYASRFDLARADEQVSTTRSALPGLAADARGAAYSLALLTGRPPEALAALADRAAPMPTPPPVVGVGLRSDLLRRRPDIREAERDLAAATADVSVATADLFPKVTLIGSIGQQAQKSGDIGSSLSTHYQFGPSLSWPILSFGRIRAQIRAADSRADKAAAVYEKAVLTAFSDSETALNRYAATVSERRNRDDAQEQSAYALDLARQRYAGGEDDLLTLLSAQSDFNTADQADLTAHAAELTAVVSLYKALGGGWESDPAKMPSD